MEMLLASVAPLVKTISDGSAPIRVATCCIPQNKKKRKQKRRAHKYTESKLITNKKKHFAHELVLLRSQQKDATATSIKYIPTAQHHTSTWIKLPFKQRPRIM